MFRVLIIGGGIHGCVIGSRLLEERRVKPDQLRIIDSLSRPMATFRTRTEATGMRFLRSPGSHSLSGDKTALLRWAAQRNLCGEHDFLGPQRRPSLKVFYEHADSVILKTGLENLFDKGTAQSIRRIKGGWRVETDRGNLDTNILILAPGDRISPQMPAWASNLSENLDVSHVFSQGFNRSSRNVDAQGPTVVVGGGISGSQVALALAATGQDTILLRRGRPEIRPYDSNPAYFGPKGAPAFSTMSSHEMKRRMIRANRWPGSVPPDVADNLARFQTDGRLDIRTGLPVGIVDEPSLALELANGSTLQAGKVILATGFESDLPLQPWLSDLADQEGLPRDGAGYPIPDPTLAWSENLFVTGSLADMVLGPGSLNILGAHKAYEKFFFTND